MYRLGLAQSKPFCFDASLLEMHPICLMVALLEAVDASEVYAVMRITY